MLPVLQTIGATVGWTFVGVVLLYGGVQLYDLLDPIDYRSEIRKGNIAAGIKLAALIVGLTAIIVTVLIF
ncbi:MAG: DUF350 domain-containing protein [Cyanobacteria bacterium J06641_5]